MLPAWHWLDFPVSREDLHESHVLFELTGRWKSIAGNDFLGKLGFKACIT
jgi:hypothetical protein